MVDIPLSNSEIYKLLDRRVKIVRYSELPDYGSIMGLLQPYGCAVILFQERVGYGHWTALTLLNIKEPTIAFFDSFGEQIDSYIDDQPLSDRKAVGQARRWLSILLVNAPPQYVIDYNDKHLQNDSSSTCGRYAVIRCDPSTRGLSNEALAEALTPGPSEIKAGITTPDQLVVRITDRMAARRGMVLGRE